MFPGIQGQPPNNREKQWNYAAWKYCPFQCWTLLCWQLSGLGVLEPQLKLQLAGAGMGSVAALAKGAAWSRTSTARKPPQHPPLSIPKGWGDIPGSSQTIPPGVLPPWTPPGPSYCRMLVQSCQPSPAQGQALHMNISWNSPKVWCKVCGCCSPPSCPAVDATFADKLQGKCV